MDQAAAGNNHHDIIGLDDPDDSASVSAASNSTASSSGFSLSAASDESSSSPEQPRSAIAPPLILRLFERLVRHSVHSDTWRYLLRAATADLLPYLTGCQSAAESRLEDPFYPGLEHSIWLTRGTREECLRWGITVGNTRRISLALDSTLTAVQLTRCADAERHDLGRGCCHVHCWPIASLEDFATCLDALYRSSLQVCADLQDRELMRGRYHGCRRG